MRSLASSLPLALTWMLLFGELSPRSLLAGLAVGLAVTTFSRSVLGGRGPRAPGRRVPGMGRLLHGAAAAARLLAVFAYEVVRANLELTRDILRPDPDLHPGFVAFEAPDLGPAESVVLATMISLTPGTITVDLDRDASTLYVHSIYADDVGRLHRTFRRFAELIHAVEGGGPRRSDSGTR